LGHGSGRLYHQNTTGATEIISEPHPLKDLMPGCDQITGPFYAEGSTWDSTFGKIASNYEECKAESVGIYLSLDAKVLKVFGHEDATPDAVHDITYINWLLMVQAGLKGLEFWTPATRAWRQAHMNGRYVILRVLLEAGEGLVTLRKKTGADGKPDVECVLDRNLISTVGKKAMGNFLLKLQVLKSLGDFDTGSKMFASYSEVPPDMEELREIVMARKEPRKLMVQQHIQAKEGGGFEVKSFEQSAIGMINSFKARFPAEDPDLMELYYKDKPHVID